MSTFLSRMDRGRYFAAGAHHVSLGFLVSAGWDDSAVSSSVLTTDGTTWDAYTTPLPIAVYDHCMVALDRNDGDFFLVGGYDDSNRMDRAFILRSSNWVEVTAMPTARSSKKSN